MVYLAGIWPEMMSVGEVWVSAEKKREMMSVGNGGLGFFWE